MTDRFSPLVSAAPRAPAAARPATPQALFGALFERVQLERVFADGKTFADAVPQQSPETILAEFRRQAPASREDLRAFVLGHFDLPAAPAPAAAGKASLTDHIASLWPRLERAPCQAEAGSSAIDLPEAYVVPGGRFREIYYWDSYFTMLGLALDGHQPLVEAMLHNFESLIERFGHVPNGTRTYYLSRSQPPFLALMADLSQDDSVAAKRRHLDALRAEYDYWMCGNSAVTLPDGAVLNRYWDDLNTPRDESFAEDVATARASGRPASGVYRDLRAGAASGWDFSSRWLGDPADFTTIRATAILPADLNALLWQLETHIARRSRDLGQLAQAVDFDRLAARRAEAIHRHMWLPDQGRFADVELTRMIATPILSAACLYPLFVGLATQAQADAVAATVRNQMLAEGGLRTTTCTTDQQWDMPNGWAPLQWIAVDGLDRYGHTDLARDIAARWLKAVTTTYDATGRLLEKYDIEAMKPGSGGEYPVQEGFGWTNGVTRALMARYPDLAAEAHA